MTVAQRLYLPEGEKAVLFCDVTCGPMRRSKFAWFFNDQLVPQNSSSSRYPTLHPLAPCLSFDGCLKSTAEPGL